MRHVGPIPTGLPAGGLLAVLSARGLDGVVREDGLWVLDEDALPGARRLLARFLERPGAPEWRGAAGAALARCERERESARAELSERARRSWRRERRLRRAFQDAASSRPLTLALLIAGAGFAATGSREPQVLLPILAALYWLHELGTHVEALRGSSRFALLLLTLAGGCQALLTGSGFGLAGLFGIGFGLLGFTAARAGLDPEAGLRVPRGLLPLMAAWLLACAAGAVRTEVFLAQSTGLALGLLIGVLPPALGRLRKASGSAGGIECPGPPSVPGRPCPPPALSKEP